MAQASPVWKKFLFPPRSNSLEPVQELDFSGDDDEALIVLLSIAHLKFQEILYARPPVRILVDLAVLCDAYLCHDLVAPWVEKWITREWAVEDDYWFDARHNWTRKPDDLKAMMLLAWVFRPESGHDLFFKGVEWIYKDNANENLTKFPKNWPMPKDLMSTCFSFPLDAC